ncbi:MAG: hypothetical protein QXV17_06940 [Candidatus Micrarchaeaceae archaeon]
MGAVALIVKYAISFVESGYTVVGLTDVVIAYGSTGSVTVIFVCADVNILPDI